MKLKLIEPLRDLFKDEVRRIGRDLDMPDEIIDRQPFPGPGLAVRILGEVTPERVAILQEADEIVVDEIKTAGLYTQGLAELRRPAARQDPSASWATSAPTPTPAPSAPSKAKTA